MKWYFELPRLLFQNGHHDMQWPPKFPNGDSLVGAAVKLYEAVLSYQITIALRGFRAEARPSWSRTIMDESEFRNYEIEILNREEVVKSF